MSKLLFRSALILCLGSWSASTALAQQVSLTISNGRVTLKTQNATVRQILEEWARVGGTKIVNAEKLAGQPVSLTLIDEPEGKALETVLRSAAGYILAERTDPTPNGSCFDRIMVMGRTSPVSTTASGSTSGQSGFNPVSPTAPGAGMTAEGPVMVDDDEPPQPTAPVVNPYAQAQGGAAGMGTPGAVSGNNGAPGGGMGTGLGQQQQQGAMPNPGYSNVYSQPGSISSPNTPGSTGSVNPPETKFDYANPQKYFQQRQLQQQTGNPLQPYPGVPLSPTGAGTNTTPSSTPQTPVVPGTGAAGTITPPPTQPNNANPASPNFNPYNLPAGQTVPGTTSTPTPTHVEPDRAKYANPYMQPGTQPPPQ